MRSKWNNKKVVIDGFKCDSLAEGEYYRLELKPRLLAGEITELMHHTRIELQPGFRAKDKTAIRAIWLEDDWRYTENGNLIVVDVKGQATTDFNIKYKLLIYRFPELDYRIIPAQQYQPKGKIERARILDEFYA